MFIAFLLKNKSLIIMAILGAIILGLTTYITVLKAQKDTLVAEKVQIKTLLDVSQSNLKQLSADIAVQNAAIDKFKADADDRKKKNANDVKTAEAAAATHKKQADDLLKSSAPQNMSKCDAANGLINKEIKNAHK